MQKAQLTFIFCLVLSVAYGQKQRFVSTYLSTQYNKTLYDRTTGNNPWSIGLGLQAFFNSKSKLKPSMELTGDIYLEDDKVLRLNPDGSIPTKSNDVDRMINMFVGISINPTQRLYFSVLAGPSFINGQTRFGFKPAVGFYFSDSEKWTGKISYLNIFNRSNLPQDDFGSLSLAIGFKLF